MPGITDLETLLATLEPEADPVDYVFATLADPGAAEPHRSEAIAWIREPEGITLVLPRAAAEAAGLAGDGPFRRITLRVHSSLHAVGLTAAVAGALAEAGISANLVAGYHHDQVFVPAASAERALAILSDLQSGACERASRPAR